MTVPCIIRPPNVPKSPNKLFKSTFRTNSPRKRIWRTSKFDNEATACGFSADGKFLAVAVGENMKGGQGGASTGVRDIYVRAVLDDDVRGSRGK